MRGPTVINYNTFIRILKQRLGNKYDEDTLREVLDSYCSQPFGILARIYRHEEFKDKHFGAFRYTEKGFLNFKDEVRLLMRQKLIMAKIVHETQRRKRGHEKKNQLSWMVGNMIDGYKYVRVQSDLSKEKVKTKIKQNEFMAGKKRAELKTDKKVRRSIRGVK